MKILNTILIACLVCFAACKAKNESAQEEQGLSVQEVSLEMEVQQSTGLVPDKQMLHIGIVVKDIDVALDHWVKLLGLESRPNISIAAGDEKNPTQYRGNPSNAQARLSFMTLENIVVELIEPIGDEESHWKEFLEKTGGGVHHVAFEVKGIGETYIESFNENGYDLAQHGGWETGEYGYMDGMEKLGVMVELIERYE